MSFGDILALKGNRQLEEIAGYLTTPIATYVHSANKSCAMSAVDLGTNRFTSVGHTLLTNEVVWPLINNNVPGVYPPAVFSTGIVSKNYPGYYVKKIDADTFELYSDVGLTTIVDITGAGDLTKWHLETRVDEIALTGLPGGTRYALKIYGQCFRGDSPFYITPNAELDATFIVSGSTTFGYPNLSIGGNMKLVLNVLIDCKNYLNVFIKGRYSNANTTIAYASGVIDKATGKNAASITSITSILLRECHLANGTIVEVYKA